MPEDVFPFGPHAEIVLRKRYLARDENDALAESPAQMLERVAVAVALAEEAHGQNREEWARRFLGLMGEGLFLPNSPALMNAGRPLGQLSACFVLPVEDSLDSIFEAVKNTALIHKSGGGTGFSFSQLRPAGDVVASTGGVSSGPVSFMRVFDVATEAIKQGGTRRGANMGLLSASHPDIMTFVRAKERPDRLCNFNLSVMIDSAFLEAVAAGGQWALRNPRDNRIVRQVAAGELWDLIVKQAHASGEPGLVFFEPINRANPTPILGVIQATNPCGEQPLLPYESCTLGSLALPRFARGGAVDYPALEEAAALAVRFLDDCIEVNRFPLPQVALATRLTRKVGLGVMGFADLLLDLGVSYDSDRAVELGGEIMARISAAARAASARLGKERGNFPAFPNSRLRQAGHTRMRNATVTTIAPTGSLSLLMGCSSGIEPHFALCYSRRVLDGEELVEINPRFIKRLAELGLDSPANLQALRQGGMASAIAGLPADEARLFATAHEIPPRRHLEIQAAFQAHTDNGVSKTVNLPSSAPVEAVDQVFRQAAAWGLKGVTVFRHGSRGRQVLELAPLPGREPESLPQAGANRCPRCGGQLATDGGCRTCYFCGASGCE
ncbi:ribonucleoside-diphosphate reductase [Desulfocarbo indianensis]|nr:ribonucleoside-diphosphate reductase [Desulfocarbo indianensis]